MEYLHIMYDCGQNNRMNLEWDFLDTPPALAWKNMLEYTIAHPKDNPLENFEMSFCRDRQEAENYWRSIKADLHFTGLVYTRIPFKKLNPIQCEKFIESLFNMINNGSIKDVERVGIINNAIRKVKHVLFYLTNIHDQHLIDGYSDSAFGVIRQFPDPHFAIEWKPDWDQYLTTNHEYGTLYAELVYVDRECWSNIIQYDISTALDKIRNNKFGTPSHIGSGYLFPLMPDMQSIEVDLQMFYWKHLQIIKQVDSNFDPLRAIQVGGRLPIAVLRSTIGYQGYPTYENFKSIERTFKMEILEEY